MHEEFNYRNHNKLLKKVQITLAVLKSKPGSSQITRQRGTLGMS